MISIDTNILFPALESSNPDHAKASGFLHSLSDRDDVALSEFALVELYGLLRNPAVLARPLPAEKAATICKAFRRHPRWQVIGFPADSRSFHDQFWPRLRDDRFARRRAFDWRMALSMIRLGVTEFATVNVKDFQDFGFERVWNPLG